MVCSQVSTAIAITQRKPGTTKRAATSGQRAKAQVLLVHRPSKDKLHPLRLQAAKVNQPEASWTATPVVVIKRQVGRGQWDKVEPSRHQCFRRMLHMISHYNASAACFSCSRVSTRATRRRWSNAS